MRWITLAGRRPHATDHLSEMGFFLEWTRLRSTPPAQPPGTAPARSSRARGVWSTTDRSGPDRGRRRASTTLPAGAASARSSAWRPTGQRVSALPRRPWWCLGPSLCCPGSRRPAEGSHGGLRGRGRLEVTATVLCHVTPDSPVSRDTKQSLSRRTGHHSDINGDSADAHDIALSYCHQWSRAARRQISLASPCLGGSAH